MPALQQRGKRKPIRDSLRDDGQPPCGVQAKRDEAIHQSYENGRVSGHGPARRPQSQVGEASALRGRKHRKVAIGIRTFRERCNRSRKRSDRRVEMLRRARHVNERQCPVGSPEILVERRA